LEIKKAQIIIQIQKAKEGNQTAFRFLLNHFWGSVYNYQLKHLQNDNDAEDITIQSFSKAFDKIATFNEDYQFKTWLISISKNVYIDFLRKKKSSLSTETTKEQEAEAYAVMMTTPHQKIKLLPNKIWQNSYETSNN